MLCTRTLPAWFDAQIGRGFLAKRVHHFGTLLLVSLFPLLEYNNDIDGSLLDVDGVSQSRETENIWKRITGPTCIQIPMQM